MNSNRRFRRSFFVVAAVHIALILGILYFMKSPIKRMNESVTWMEPGSFSSTGAFETSHEGASVAQEQKEESTLLQEPSEKKAEVPPPPERVTIAPQTEPSAERENKALLEEAPSQSENKPLPEPSSEIKIPLPPQVVSKPAPEVPPKITSVPKPTPKQPLKPVSKPLPKPIPKSKPKPEPVEEEDEKPPKPVVKLLSKPSASLKKNQHVSSSKKEEASSSKKKEVENKQKSVSSGESHQNDAAKKAFLAAKQGAGSSSESSGSGSGHGEGGVDNAALGAYHELIHDRFYSQWDQPTSIPLEHKHDFVCTLRLTIEQDGTISHFMLAKPSGNPVMDQSVLTAAAKVTKIAPLPLGLGTKGAYTVNINFELE